MFLGMMEHNGQNKWTCVLLERHPWIRKHHSRVSINAYHMMIVIHQLLCLSARTDGNRLVRIHEWLWHLGILPQAISGSG